MNRRAKLRCTLLNIRYWGWNYLNLVWPRPGTFLRNFLSRDEATLFCDGIIGA